MSTYTLAYSASTTVTDSEISDAHFGANALYEINMNEDTGFKPNDGFEAAIDALEITQLRYPGGHTESSINITKMTNGELRSEVTSFLDWCAAKTINGVPLEITLVLPTKTDIPADDIEAFVQAVLEEYGDLISGFEIGNEYSIGTEDDDADRSEHPEENPDSSFVAAMGETEYGIVANTVINAVQDGIDAATATLGNAAPDPTIMLQLAETSGGASDYKSEGLMSDEANSDILDQLDDRALDAIDAVAVHYYYNDQHEDDEAFDEGWQEIRSLDDRLESFEALYGSDLDVAITEWGVIKHNYSQLGAASASVLLEMFENMLEIGVDEAQIWPLQHRTGNTIAGNRNADDVYLTMAGGIFDMMSDALRPAENADGTTSSFYLQDTTWAGGADEIEITHFASDYQDVIYVSLRDLAASDVALDLGHLMDGVEDVTVQQLTIDPASSDGLSDFSGNGDAKFRRRTITEDELNQLETLVFFDPDNGNHVKYSGDDILTYLPPFETIVALVANPQTLEDYYFTTEQDTAPLVSVLATDLLSSGTLDLDMLPYDVVEITLTYEANQSISAQTIGGSSAADRLIGTSGNDRFMASEGADQIDGGSGLDTVDFSDLKGRALVDLQNDVAGSTFAGFYDYGHAGGDTYENVETYSGGYWADNLRGDATDNTLSGGRGADRLYGRAGNDTLYGNDGRDVLYGNSGADTMSGGDETGVRDRYVYFNAADTGTGAGSRDIITDYEAGVDRIEISRLDADITTGYAKDTFSYIGDAGFSRSAGELGYYFNSGKTIVQADLDGDAVADFEIELTGTITLTVDDFLI